jgi:hypothetical protein
LKHLRPTAVETSQLFLERVDFLLRLHQGMRQGSTATPSSDEIDEVGEPPLLRHELCFLHADGFGDMTVECPDFCLHTLEHMLQMFRRGELCANRIENDLLYQFPADQ